MPAEFVIPQDRIVDLTAQMDKDGRLAWDAPPGRWTVLRFGHTITGARNAPAPASGRGWECDKLSKEGIEAQFAGMMDKLVRDCGVKPGEKTGLVATHIDSWENGSQNWTARMREEFQKRRGYDLLRFLPVMTGRVVDSLEVSERFLWDLRQTISDLVVENYAGRMRAVGPAEWLAAFDRGLRRSLRRLHLCRTRRRADGRILDGRQLPAEPPRRCPRRRTSTAGGSSAPSRSRQATTERWLQHPASIKTLGDAAFCLGINRFVFHRYAMQPWLNYRPGHDDGAVGAALRADRDVVGAVAAVARVSRPLPALAAAGAVRRRHLLLAARGRRRKVSSRTTATATTTTIAARRPC